MRFTMLAAAAVVALAAGDAFAQAEPKLGPGPKVSIKTVTQSNPTNLQYTKVDVPWLKEKIPARSGGRVEVTTSTNAEMNLTGNEMIRLVRQGQVDIGGGTLATLSGDVPFLDALDLPGLNPTLAQLRKVVDASLPIANRELERFNTRIVAAYPFSAQIFFCRAPVSGLADLKGRKVRVFGPALNDFMSAIGAQGVSIGFPEVYAALERGVADCAVTGTGSGNTAKWTEVTTVMYTLPLGWAISAYFVNVAWWNKLDPDVRAFLEANLKEIEAAQWKLAADTTQDGIDCNAGRASCALHTRVTAKPLSETRPTAADQAVLQKVLAETVLPNWVKRCGASCGHAFNTVLAPVAGVKATVQ